MPMRIKVDEDLPAEVADLLQDAGHDARSVVGQGMTGMPDEGLWRVVQGEGMCLFTADKGFANAQVFPPGTHGGIVLLRLPRESRAGYVRLTESLLASVNVESAIGAIMAVTPDAIRIHRGG